MNIKEEKFIKSNISRMNESVKEFKTKFPKIQIPTFDWTSSKFQERLIRSGKIVRATSPYDTKDSLLIQYIQTELVFDFCRNFIDKLAFHQRVLECLGEECSLIKEFEYKDLLNNES